MDTSARGDGREAEPAGDRGGADPAVPRSSRVQVSVLLAVAVFVLAADVISKVVVVADLSGHAPVRLLGGLLTLRLIRNSGAAFSIGTSLTFVFTAIAVGVIVFILRTARRLRSMPWAVTLGLLLGGAMGNLGDRLFRAPGPMRGDVVDWIQLPHWPVFNLADSAIVCGGVLAVLLAVRGLRMDGTVDAGGKPERPGPPGGPGPARQAGPATRRQRAD
jgi:signal peptidase II